MLFKRWCFSFPYSTHSSCCKVSMVQVYLFDNFNYCTYFSFSQKVGRTILTTYQFSVPWCPTVISNSTNLTERYSWPHSVIPIYICTILHPITQDENSLKIIPFLTPFPTTSIRSPSTSYSSFSIPRIHLLLSNFTVFSRLYCIWHCH